MASTMVGVDKTLYTQLYAQNVLRLFRELYPGRQIEGADLDLAVSAVVPRVGVGFRAFGIGIALAS